MIAEMTPLTTVGEVTLSYKRNAPLPGALKLTSSSAMEKFLRPYFDENTMEYRETCLVLYLSNAMQPLAVYKLSQGGLTGTVVDIRMIFQGALLTNATGLIVAHNHPSGNLKPSYQDKRITKELIEAGKILLINVYDHLILTTEGHTSLADQGLL